MLLIFVKALCCLELFGCCCCDIAGRMSFSAFVCLVGGSFSISLYFSNAGNTSAAIFWWFLASAVVLRKGSPSAGASARALADM